VSKGNTYSIDARTGETTSEPTIGPSTITVVFEPIEVELDTVDLRGQHLGGLVWRLVYWPSDQGYFDPPHTLTMANSGDVKVQGVYGGLASPTIWLTVSKGNTYSMDALTGDTSTAATPERTRVNFVFPFVTNVPPVADAGVDQEVEQTGRDGARVVLDGSASADADGDVLTYTWAEGDTMLAGPTADPQAEVTLQLGAHSLTLTVTDGMGGTDTDDVLVVVEDSSGPDLTLNQPDPSLLWPPNHRLVQVTITGTVTDVCDADLHVEASVDVADPGRGDPQGDGGRNHDPDYIEPTVAVAENGSLRIVTFVRAERAGSHQRVYTITVTATDYSGNATSESVDVVVPHDPSGGGGKKK